MVRADKRQAPHWRKAAAHLILSTSLLAGSAAQAQTASDVLPPTREEVTRPLTAPPAPRAPRLEVEGGIERAPCALDGPEYQSIKLTLRGAEFDGLQGLTRAQMAEAYAPYVGREQPIAVVCDIRDRAATILRNAGYIAAVQVPPQTIGDGIVRFQVLMAHLTQVRVRGDATGAEKIIAGYLNQLTKQPVFNRNDAERYLLLASDLPGYSVRLTLRPAGTKPGDVIGDVTVQRTPAYADFNVQNGGSDSLGPWGGLLRAQLFGLTGLGDRTTIGLYSTSDFKEQQTLQLAHDFRVGTDGLALGGAFTYAWARPSIPNAKVLARTLLTTVQADYPFIRTQSHNLRGTFGLDYVNQDVKLDGLDLTRDRLRVGFVRLSMDAAKTDVSGGGWNSSEPPWRMASVLELRQGLHILGATDDCGTNGAACLLPGVTPPSRIERQSDATVLRYTTFGEYRPVPKITLALTARGQIAWKPLLSFEEFSAGNYTVGRGYDPGSLIGDSGFGTQSELRFGSRVPANSRSAAYEGYLFWDNAFVRNRDRLTVVAGRQHLNSVGAGARVSFNRFALDAALAVPLTRIGIDNERPDPRVLISLTTRLWPWSY